LENIAVRTVCSKAEQAFRLEMREISNHCLFCVVQISELTMKKMRLLLTVICILLLSRCFGAEDETKSHPSDVSKRTDARQLLEAYDSGKLTLDDLIGEGDQPQRIVAYYDSNTNAITTKMKLPISRFLIGSERYHEAASLARQYVGTYSNDWRGWDALGRSSFFMKSFDEAVDPFLNAVRLGRNEDYGILAFAAMVAERMELLTNTILPRLLVLKDSEELKVDDRLEMVAVLLAYARETHEKELFTKAVAGLDASDLEDHELLKNKVLACCEELSQNQVGSVCERLLKGAGSEGSDTRQLLKDYDRGKLTLDELTDDNHQARLIILSYLSDTNAVTTNMKLPISRCFAEFGKFQESAELAKEYLGTYSNNWRGWRMLGASLSVMKSYKEAVPAYTNAVRLGDTGDYVALGGAALESDRMDVLTNIVVPQLLVLKDSKDTKLEDRFEMISILLAYSLEANDPGTFMKAIAGLEAKDVADRESIKCLISNGCQLFGTDKVGSICQRLLKDPPHCQQ
jgi:tetratricopeptide (TPR) repeat protein